LLIRLLRPEKHLLLYDPNNEYGDLVPKTEYELVERIPAAIWRAFGMLGYLRLAPDLQALPKIPDRHVVRSSGAFDAFLDLVSEAQGYAIAVDEAHQFWESHRRRFDEFIRTMRHREQSWYLISHRAAWVPRSIQSQVDRLVLFQTTSGRDLRYLQLEYEGIDTDELRALGIGQYVDLAVSRKEIWKQ